MHTHCKSVSCLEKDLSLTCGSGFERVAACGTAEKWWKQDYLKWMGSHRARHDGAAPDTYGE